MVKMRLSLYSTMIILLVAFLLFPGSVKAEKVLYIGGTMS
jgi:hypothetical protein